MGRAPCCDKANVKKGPWSPEEDAKLKSYIETHGTGGNWIALPQKIGLKRCGKSCRLRWLNYLRPNIKHGGFSEEEDNIICSLYISIGSRWSIIAAQLPGRTDNDIKNYWNTRLKKKLLGGKQRSKDQQHHQARRASGLIKEEQVKREDHSGGLGPDPLAVPVCPAGQAEHRAVGDEHSSIRKLLMKLGGRFSSDASGLPVPSSAPLGFQGFGAAASTSLVVAPAHSGGFVGGASGYSMELDDMYFDCGQAKLEGLDCFYGGVGGIVDEGRGMISGPECASWGEVSPPLAYPQMVSGYQGLSPCMLDEQVQLGAQ